MAMDCTYRLRIPHTTGQLARVATALGYGSPEELSTGESGARGRRR